MQPSPRAALLQGMGALVLVLALIAFSEHGYKASVSGLKLFFDVVFPSLLPFFVLSELLLALGVVHFLGELFEPVMRPVFNVPGVGSFVLSMGLAAGYPMDAVITAKFRRQGLCTKIEGERLLAFTNTADPLFIFGAVAVGMFGYPALGAALATAHYASAFLVGLAFRFWGARTEPYRPEARLAKGSVWTRAARALVEARRADGRPIGTVLKDAIAESIATLFMIMAFIVLFSVFLAVLDRLALIGALTAPLGLVLRLFGLDPHLARAVLSGLFEIDLGSAAAAAAHAPFLARAIVASAIIAWSGLSVHGQVAAVLAGTDISMRPYFLARALHAVLAGALTALVVRARPDTALPAFAHGPAPAALGPALGLSLRWGVGVTAALLAAAVLVGAARSLRVIRFRIRP